MKFKSGDRIKVIGDYSDECFYATVARAKPSESQYWVVWDHHPGEHSYCATEVDEIWENACSVINNSLIKLPTGFQVIKEKLLQQKENQDCIHKWANYNGFAESYKFCENCDEKRYDG